MFKKIGHIVLFAFLVNLAVPNINIASTPLQAGYFSKAGKLVIGGFIVKAIVSRSSKIRDFASKKVISYLEKHPKHIDNTITFIQKKIKSKSPKIQEKGQVLISSIRSIKDFGKATKQVYQKKPYSKHRPSYKKEQVDNVWENAKGRDGKVRDPNTKELLKWDRDRARNGQWDMGHKQNQEYRKLHEKYMNGDISKKKFLEKYRDSKNYQPESVNANRSRKYETN